jgi:hypothetical protein
MTLPHGADAMGTRVRILMITALVTLGTPLVADAQTYHVQTSTGAAIIPGDTDVGNHCDNCTTDIVFPFPVRFYLNDVPVGTVSSNGNLQFLSTSVTSSPGCLPIENLDFAILPYQADLRTDRPGNGIFTGLSGTAPHRVFVIEWRASSDFWAGTANFEIVFREDSPIISVIYGNTTDHGAFAVSGVQQSTGAYTRTGFSCLEAILTPGLRVDYVPVTLDLVVRGADNGLYQNRFGETGWLGWTALGGTTDAAPALQDNGSLFLAVHAPDGGLEVNRLVDTAWDGFTRLPGAILDTPALTFGPGTSAGVELVARGLDNGLYHNRFSGATWLGWTPLGGAAASGPAIDLGILPSGPTTVHAVVRGADNGIYHNVFADDTGWAGWTALGGATLDTPAVSFEAFSLDGLHVVIRGTDNRVYHGSLTGGVWSGWTDLGIETTSAPALVGLGSLLFVAVRGLDNGVLVNIYDGTVWTGWTVLGGGTPDTPALAFSFGPSLTLHVVVRGTDDGIYENVYDLVAWSGWKALGGATLSRPALASR